jgi:hypothetical protein
MQTKMNQISLQIMNKFILREKDQITCFSFFFWFFQITFWDIRRLASNSWSSYLSLPPSAGITDVCHHAQVQAAFEPLGKQELQTNRALPCLESVFPGRIRAIALELSQANRRCFEEPGFFPHKVVLPICEGWTRSGSISLNPWQCTHTLCTRMHVSS